MSPGPKFVASSGQALRAAPLPCPQPCALHGFRVPSKPQNHPSPGLHGLHLRQDKAWQTTHCCARPGTSDTGRHLQLWDMSAELTSLDFGHPLQTSYRDYCTLFCRTYCWTSGKGRSTQVFPLRGTLHSSRLISPSCTKASRSPQRARPTSCTPAAAAKSRILPEDVCSLQS